LAKAPDANRDPLRLSGAGVNHARVLDTSAVSLHRRLARSLGLLLLAKSVRRFYRAAELEAERVDDRRALETATAPLALARLLRLAAGRRTVAEIGTAAGWTALSFALADERRSVFSLDPFPHPGRDRYAELVPESVHSRVEFVEAYGEAGAPPGVEPDLLFIDEAHEREGVVACFRAWRPALAPGALVVFHDYDLGWPGVIEAVDELGLEGRVRAKSFIWRVP
jgi:predicted O-methyltransferase YrrM